MPRKLPPLIRLGEAIVVSECEGGHVIFGIKVIRREFDGVGVDHPMLDGFDIKGRALIEMKQLSDVSHAKPI